MIKDRTKLLCLIIFLASVITTSAADWVQKSERDGIRVYTRLIEGSNIQEFKGETVVNCNIKQVNAIVDNVPNLENWMADTGTNYVLDTFNSHPDGNKELFLFNISTTPFGIAYRCGVFYSKITVTEKMITRTVELAPDSQLTPAAKNALNTFYTKLPLNKNGRLLKKSALNEMVRFTEMHGLWTFEKLGESRTKVSWSVKLNPGGYIPSAFANATAKNNPYNTLKGLITQIR